MNWNNDWKNCRARSPTCATAFDVAGLQKRAAHLEEVAATPQLWDDREGAQKTLGELARLKKRLEALAAAEQRIADLDVFYQLYLEEHASPEDLEIELKAAEEQTERLALFTFLSGPYDAGDALVEIKPGAGGIDAADFAEMLLRMYLRWCERRGFTCEVLDAEPAEEAGIRVAVVEVRGDYAFGYLSAEAGIHRLVRISPFDQKGRRHTSFVSVAVWPKVDETVEVAIDEKELRIETFRSSGPGGQHVNVTDSAVRITHIPSGIVVSCQAERSQHLNRARAMSVLRAKLHQLAREEHRARIEGLKGPKQEIAWGNQIRSYVLQPYRMVKDLRTGYETGNVDAVLDGDLDALVNAALKWRNLQGGRNHGDAT